MEEQAFQLVRQRGLPDAADTVVGQHVAPPLRAIDHRTDSRAGQRALQPADGQFEGRDLVSAVREHLLGSYRGAHTAHESGAQIPSCHRHPS